MERPTLSAQKSRIGFHYYPDTLHYGDQSLKLWLPKLKLLNSSWVILDIAADRAIPESFISGLVRSGVQPILHLNIPPESMKPGEDLDALFHAYARWGVRQVILFDRPNVRTSWSVQGWVQKNLVDNFLDYFLPLASSAVRNGLNPILPPLHPGGDYWDTAFLQSCFQKILKTHGKLIDHLQLASYAWTWGKSLNWGAGGPQVWANARPYSSPDEQDQRGFRTYEWYDSIAQNTLGKSLPIHLLGAGLPFSPDEDNDPVYFEAELTDTALAIAGLCSGEVVPDKTSPGSQLSALPRKVVSTNFWLLAVEKGHDYEHMAWFRQDGTHLPVVDAFLAWSSEEKTKKEKLVREKPRMKVNSQHVTAFASHQSPKIQLAEKAVEKTRSQVAVNKLGDFKRPIKHYLLLPVYEWGIADWHLDVIQPFVKKYHPTIGFSIKEAALAEKVTVVGNAQSFPDALLEKFRTYGCEVERIDGDGTTIATELSSR